MASQALDLLEILIDMQIVLLPVSVSFCEEKKSAVWFGEKAV